MATKTFYWKDAVPSGATLHRSLQDGGSAPGAATTATGWIIATNAVGNSCLQLGGSEVPRNDGTWGTTLQPSVAPSQTRGDCWRSENTLNGTFANTSWTFTFGVRSVTAAYTGRFKLAVRVWRSSNQNGASAVELTSARQASAATTADLATASDTTITVTWSPGGQMTLTNEYLFVNVGVEVTTAATSGTTKDCDFRVGSGYTLVTPDFTVAPVEGDQTETGSAVDSPDNTAILNAAGSESASAADAPDRSLLLEVARAEGASALDTPTIVNVDHFADLWEHTRGQPSAWLPAIGLYWAQPQVETQDGDTSGIKEGSQTESASAADVQSVTAIYLGAQTESATAFDTIDGQKAGIDGSMTEAASALDTSSATLTVTKDQTESASAVDAPNRTADYAASGTETASALDTVGNVATLNASRTEAATAADSPDASKAGQVDAPASETASAVDAPNATGNLFASRTEAASAVDAPAVTATYLGSRVESASALDAPDATAGTVIPGSRTEAANAVDTVTCTVIAQGSIADGTASAVDVANATAIWQAFISEQASATDILGSTAVFQAAQAEFAAAGDVSTGGLFLPPVDVAEQAAALEITNGILLVREPDPYFTATAAGRVFVATAIDRDYGAIAAGRAFVAKPDPPREF